MPGVVPSSTQKPAETPAERYQRLHNLYLQLNNELATLEKEGHGLVEEIQAAIDKEKIDQIFQSIHKKTN